MTRAVSRQIAANVARETGKEYAVAITPARTAPDAVPASKPMFQPALAADSLLRRNGGERRHQREVLQRAVTQAEHDRRRDQHDVLLPGHRPRAHRHGRRGTGQDRGQEGPGAAPIRQRRRPASATGPRSSP